MSAENLKWRVNRAVRKSNLPPPARLIMFVLSDMADAKTGVIPEKKTPSLPELAEDTGHGESTVKAQLLELERLGWVIRTRPTAGQRARHVSTGYRIQVGDAGEKREPPKRKPRARSKPSNDTTEGQEQALAEGQEMAPESESEGQELADRGPGDSSPRARRWPSYLKDDDQYDLDDLSATADAATRGDGDGLFDPPSAPRRAETDKQRAYRLAAGYTTQVRLSNKDAVAGVVHKAVLSTGLDGEPYTDEQITTALQQLITERRSVTADSLRIALDGPPVPRQRSGNHEGFKNPTNSSAYDGEF